MEACEETKADNRENIRKKRFRRLKAVVGVVVALFVIYNIAIYFMVSAVLVPSFMDKLEAFERITEDSYAAQVQTTDIKTNRREALDETKQWLAGADCQKLAATSEDGYRLIAMEFFTKEDSHKWVLLLHGYTDAYSMFGDKITEWFHLPPFPFVDSAVLMLRLRGGYDLRDASAIAAVAKSDVPTLFIHGDQDAMIDVGMAHELYEAATCEKALLIVEGAGHAQSQDKAPELYYGAIEEFLEKYLEW